MWYVPRHAQTFLRAYAGIESPDQPAHPRSLIRAFAVRLLNSWILLNVSMESKCPDETLRMRAMNLNLCILHMSEDTLLHGAAHMIVIILTLHRPVDMQTVGVGEHDNAGTHRDTVAHTSVPSRRRQWHLTVAAVQLSWHGHPVLKQSYLFGTTEAS